MNAVFVTGGKQYRVQPGDKLRVEKLSVDEGGDVEFDRVLLVTDGDNVEVGTPYIQGGKISAKVRGHGRGKKINVVKFRRRKGYMRHQGHRQAFTEVEIMDISTGAGG